MEIFFQFLYLASLAIWLGSVAFFGFVAAPDVMSSVPKDQALRIVCRMARPYVHLTWICGSVAFLSSFFLPAVEGRYVTVRIVLTAVMFSIALYVSLGSGARVRAAGRALEAAEDGEVPKEALADFDAFHGTVSQMNGALLLIGLIALFITAFHS